MRSELQIGDIIKLNRHWFVNAVDAQRKIIELEAFGVTRHGRTQHRSQDQEKVKQAHALGLSIGSDFALVSHALEFSRDWKIDGFEDHRNKAPYQAILCSETGRIRSKKVTLVIHETSSVNADSRFDVVNKRGLKFA